MLNIQPVSDPKDPALSNIGNATGNATANISTMGVVEEEANGHATKESNIGNATAEISIMGMVEEEAKGHATNEDKGKSTVPCQDSGNGKVLSLFLFFTTGVGAPACVFSLTVDRFARSAYWLNVRRCFN
jgi:hypothetical protein